MRCKLRILRRRRGSNESFWQDFIYETDDRNDTVATALRAINDSADPEDHIEWESSCLQKKCGACAMVINGKPRLACGARLGDLAANAARGSETGEEAAVKVTVEPLRKFPVIADLLVDRSILYQNLKTMKLWLTEEADLPDRYRDLAYEAAGCIQCGCCLEVCPNFYAGGKFFGMATVPITMRLLAEMDRASCREIAREYGTHTFAGCGKSLACRDVCPKGIDTEKLLVNSNAVAVWKRRLKRDAGKQRESERK